MSNQLVPLTNESEAMNIEKGIPYPFIDYTSFKIPPIYNHFHQDTSQNFEPFRDHMETLDYVDIGNTSEGAYEYILDEYIISKIHLTPTFIDDTSRNKDFYDT